MLNKVILQGNIGRDPKVILMQDGKEIIIFPLATSQQWKDESGEWHSRADWHQITVSRKSTLKWIKDILKQGDPIYVEGKLCYRSKKDKFGHSHSTAHIVVSEKEGCVKCLRPTPPLSSSGLYSNPEHQMESQTKTLPQEVVLKEEPHQSSKTFKRNI